MSDVTIKYKGQSIATMDASGTKTLGTQGKYCEGDIGVEYVKPAGPTGTKSISITENGTTTEDVAAYASAEITVNVQGGGGGLQLLGSGSYTYTEAAAQQIFFPVSYTGTPKILLCLKDSQDAGVGETLGGYKVLATGISTIDDAFTKGTCAYLIKSAADAVMYQGVAPGDTQCIWLCDSRGGYDADGSYMKISRYGNAYLMQPGSYSYYIYG